LFPHRAVFFLTGRIQDVEQCDLVIDETLFTVRILDSRVVPTG
jgi:hypothetical protein